VAIGQYLLKGFGHAENDSVGHKNGPKRGQPTENDGVGHKTGLKCGQEYEN
jgi:hypothetical protein